MNLAEYEQLKDQINSARALSFTDSFALAKQCSQLLGQQETEHYGRDLAIRILEHSKKVDPKTKEIWTRLGEPLVLEDDAKKIISDLSNGTLPSFQPGQTILKGDPLFMRKGGRWK